MKLRDFKAKYKALSEKKNLQGKEAMEAVKQDGLALQYVKEQTEAICIEAVKQNGYALQYVDSRFFENVPDEIIELNGKKYKLID